MSDRHPPHVRQTCHELDLNELDSFNESVGGKAATHPQEKKTSGDRHKLVKLYEFEYDGLVSLYGESVVNDYINRLDKHLAHVGEKKAKKYPNHYATIDKWIDEDVKKNKQQISKNSSQNRFINFNQRNTDYDQLEKLERAFLAEKLKNSERDRP